MAKHCNLVQKTRISHSQLINSLPSTAPNALASHGSLQAAREFPRLHPQANDKTHPRPVYALQRPSAYVLLGKWLGDPLGSWGLYSSLRGSYTCRWSEPLLGRGCQWFGHMLRIWSFVSSSVPSMLQWFEQGLKTFTSYRVA